MNSQLLLPPAAQLSTEQSLALVQIFLNCSIACICHTRELLRWTSDCFRIRYIDQIALVEDTTNLYSGFCQNELGQGGSSQEVRVLIRSHEKRANQILDMLESGVFHAIERRYLESIQILIMESPHHTASVLESYRFTVTYHNENLAGIQLSGSEEDICSFSSTQKSLKAAIRTLLRCLQGRPRLQRKRYSLRMSLSYTQTCPKTYQPDGFADASDSAAAVLQRQQNSSRTGFDGISFRSSFHTIHIDTNIQTVEQEARQSQLQDTHMSKELQNMQHTSQNKSTMFAMISTAETPEISSSGTMDKNSGADSSAGCNNETSMMEIVPLAASPVAAGIRRSQRLSVQSQRDMHQLPGPDGSINTSSKESILESNGVSKRKASGPSVDNMTPRRRRTGISHEFINVGESSPFTISSEGQIEDHFGA